MRNHYYKMVNRKVYPCNMCESFLSKKGTNGFSRRIRLHYEGGYRISTVFLVINHALQDSETPILFETMVFDGNENDVYVKRATTHRGALKAHIKAREWVITTNVKCLTLAR